MDTASLRLRIFNGSRQLFPQPFQVLVRIIDGTQKQQLSQFFKASELLFKDLPFYDNFGDNYTVIVTADGYKDAGFFPVKLSNKFTQSLDIMLVPKQPGFSFANAKWPAAKKAYPFLGSDVDDAAGKARYGELVEAELPLACMLNILEAASDIPLQQGTPLDYIRQIRWEDAYAPKQDRFFCWCDAALLDQVRIGEAAKLFAPAPAFLHPGATHSWKEIQFSEADLQITFHESDRKTLDGAECTMVELDIDYFSDPLAHTFLEVFPHGLAHTLTNPVEVYVLRWMAGRMAKTFEFAPLYTVID